MTINNKNIIFKSSLLVIILASLFLISAPVLAATNAIQVQFKPQIGIPNSEFQAGTGVAIGTEVNNNGTTTSRSDLMARYVSAFYNWSLTIVSVIAVLMLMAAGLLWLTSGGDSEKINQAKKLIGNSLLGCGLLIGSWFLLNTINPNLTSLPVIETVTIANLNTARSCDAKGTKATCEELLFCEWKDAKCVGKKGQCSKDKKIFGSEKVLCCCQSNQNGKLNNCNWATYMGGVGVGPDSGPCTACGSTFLDETNNPEGLSLCTAASDVIDNTKPDYSTTTYCHGYWCNNDNAMVKFYYCNPVNKNNGDSCPHDGYCYDKACWTADDLGNNKAEIGEPCGNESPAGKCYSECPNGYKHEFTSLGGRDCNNSTCCILNSQ